LYDVDLVVDWLRVHYHDYTRKKKDAFRSFVERALVRYIRDHPQKRFEAEEAEARSESSMGDDAPDETNWMNTTLAMRYRRSATPQRSGGSDAASTTPLQRAQAADAESAEQPPASVRKRKRAAFIAHRRRAAMAYAGVTATDGAPAPPARFGESGLEATTPNITFADIAGIDDVLQDVEELVHYPLRHPEIYRHLGVDTPCGILLHGAPGCGKTMLAKAIAGEYRKCIVATVVACAVCLIGSSVRPAVLFDCRARNRVWHVWRKRS
jgi:SpoVK/Ycf46/Vps4 family AAA+-type ATPase